MVTEYEVVISNYFAAESPEDAVLQMAAWLDENAYQAGYRVNWTDGVIKGNVKVSIPSTKFVDAEDIDYSKL